MSFLLTLTIGIISYLVVAFLALPYLNSFAYTKKNVLPHIGFGVLLAFIHSKIGFYGIFDTLFYLGILYFSNREANKGMMKKNPQMNDIFGHMTVKKANTLFYIAFVVTYILLNFKIV